METHAQQGRPQMRDHRVTSASSIELVKVNATVGKSQVQESISGSKPVIRANGLPGHEVGRIPNKAGPHRIKAQNRTCKMSQRPKVGRAKPLQLAHLFGVAVNGVAFDAGAAEYRRGNPPLGW